MNISYLVPIIWLSLLIAAVVDCLNSNNHNKVGWVAVIVLLPILGSLLYFQSRRGRIVIEL